MPTTPELDFSADQLNIETPEQVDLRFPIAGVGSRMIAVFLDMLIQIAVYLLLGLAAYITSSFDNIDNTMSHASNTMQKWLVAGFVLLNFILLVSYYIVLEAYWNGQTPGKRVMKLRVLKDSGRSITFFESLTRNLVRFVDYLPSFYVFGLICMLCNRQNKRLGDFAAGTIVVHERGQEQPFLAHNSRTFTAATQGFAGPAANDIGLMPKAREAWVASGDAVPADVVARLTPQDLHIIETFFSRALDLSIETRATLGARVAQTMCTKMQFPLPDGMPPERMLELIAVKMRSQGR
jgi:uncharacterized RDD family membrane protein YckC